MSKLARDLHSLERQQELLTALRSDLESLLTVRCARRLLDRYLQQNLVCQKAVQQLLNVRRSAPTSLPVSEVNQSRAGAYGSQ